MKNIYAIMVQNEDGIITLLEFHTYYFWARHRLKTYLNFYKSTDKLFIGQWDMNQMVDDINQNSLGKNKND